MSVVAFRLLVALAAVVPALSACDALDLTGGGEETRPAKPRVEDRVTPPTVETPATPMAAPAAPGDESTPAAPIPYDQLRAPVGSGGEPELKSDDVFY
jgi:hypothetical protein